MSIINLTVTPPPVINLAVSESAPIALTVSQPDPINLTVYPTLVQEGGGTVSETELVQIYEFGEEARGDWCEGPVGEATYDYTQAGIKCVVTLDDNAPATRAFLRESGHQATPWTPQTRITEYDFLFTWTGKVLDLDPMGEALLNVGFFRTHGGDNFTESFERIVGFYIEPGSGEWTAGIWRADPPGTSIYTNPWYYYTPASIFDEHTLQVAISNRGTRATFYVDGKIVGTADGGLMPIASDSGPTNAGDKLHWGLCLRDMDNGTNAYPTQVEVKEMMCRQYKLNSMTGALADKPLTQVNVSPNYINANQTLVFNNSSQMWENKYLFLQPFSDTTILPAAAPGAAWNDKVPLWNNTTGWNPATLPVVPAIQSYKLLPDCKTNVSDRFAPQVVNSTSMVTASYTITNTMRLTPFRVGYDMNLWGMEAYVITGGTATAFKFILYNSDADGRPTGAPIAESGSISTTASSTSHQYLLPSNIPLTAGKTYWIGMRHQSISGFSVSFRGFTTTSFHPITFVPNTGVINYAISTTDTYTGAARNFTTTPWNRNTEVLGGTAIPAVWIFRQ